MHRTISAVALAAALFGCTGPMSASGPHDRVGLGTTWGETRRSQVRLVDFERADPVRPDDVATLYYDDADGVRAMTAGASVNGPADEAVELGGGALWLRVLDAWGNPLPIFSRAGRRHVEGRDGERYTIELANRSREPHRSGRHRRRAGRDERPPRDLGKSRLHPRALVVIPHRRLPQEPGSGGRLPLRVGRRFVRGAEGRRPQRRRHRRGVVRRARRRRDVFDRESERRRGANPFPGAFADPP